MEKKLERREAELKAKLQQLKNQRRALKEDMKTLKRELKELKGSRLHPVSYTHLDVYKRQGPTLLPATIVAGLNWAMSFVLRATAWYPSV